MQLRDASCNDGKNDGLLNSICVRVSVRWPGLYEVVDGMYRFTAYQELRIPMIPAIIVEMTDEQVLAAQIQANSIRRETTAVEFAKQLLRIKSCIRGITMSTLSKMVSKTPTWIKQQLSLLELDDKTQRRVDRDEIPLRNAYMLAKIPPYAREPYTLLASITPVEEFQALTEVVIRQVMEAARSGKLIQNFATEYIPQPFLKPLRVILNEIKSRKFAVKAALNKEITTPLEGWIRALEWASSLDPESQEKQKAAVERRTSEQKIQRDQYRADIEEFNP